MRQIAKFIILFLVLSILSSLVSAYDYPYCGDGICNPDGSEDGWCSDCGVIPPAPYCGDGICNPDGSEDGWCSDCGVAPTPYCGDGVCDSGEAGWCSDCDVAPTPYCGDGVCDSGEAGWCSDCDVTPAPPCTPAAWSCTNWEPNVCPSNGIRTRTCTLIDTTCTNPNAVKPSETQSCTYVPPTPTCTDSDADSYYAQAGCGTAVDCNDANANINPGKTEVCNGIDDDCDGLIDEWGVCGGGGGGPVCTDADADSYYAQTGCGTAVDCNDAVSSINPGAAEVCDGVDNDCDGLVDEGGICGSSTNNPPTITEFTFPATANKNTYITVKVTANDSDGIDRIEILENGNLQTKSCGGIVECTKEFIIHLPDAFDTIYTIIAKAFDSLGAFTTQTKSGQTNPPGTCTPAAWSCTAFGPNICPSNGIRTRTCTLIDTTCTNPNAVKPSETQSCTPGEEIEEEIINRNIRSDELLISSIIPDPEYAAPGDEILLYVSVKNEGKNRFKNLQITAMIKELGIKAVSSPFTLKERDTISKTLFFNIPHYAKPGLYYIKIEVASDSDHTARYRIFEVY